jgi:hypothetical protein
MLKGNDQRGIMIESIINLAKEIERGTVNGDHFSGVSCDLLNNFSFEHSLENFESELENWLLSSELPKQLNVYNTFGQPPVTLFNNGKFVIDIYFWMHVDTSIHSHSFSGAFKVLFGNSIHETFKIQPKKIYAPDVMKTEIERFETKLLETGDTIEIFNGNRFIHRIIHLDSPTVTLCVRTVTDETKSQWHHFSNGLSIEKKILSESVIKNLYFYQYLFGRNEAKAMEFAENLVRSWSISVSLNLYEQLSIDSMGLSDEAIGTFFEIVFKEYGESEWFKTYENFYRLMEEFIEFEDHSAQSRFMEHAINTHYSFKEASALLERIQDEGLSPFQVEQLKVLS